MRSPSQSLFHGGRLSTTITTHVDATADVPGSLTTQQRIQSKDLGRAFCLGTQNKTKQKNMYTLIFFEREREREEGETYLRMDWSADESYASRA